jgi:predicted CXXCH cytochrome family protein
MSGMETMGKRIFYLAVLVVSVIGLLGLGFGGQAFAASGSCVTSQCHAKMGKAKYVHGPAAVGQCEFCHQPVAKHKFKPIKDVAKLCYQCHDKKDEMKTVHPPVKAGECTSCHDPHQSPYKFQLRAAGEDLCFLCHDKKKITGGKYVHDPVAAGGCSTCHDPHESNFPKMLPASGNDVCFQCHTDKQEEFKNAKFVHPPVADACVNCHSPHSTNYPNNLLAQGNRDLCFTCHDDKKTEVEEATVKHGGLDTDKKCLACHDPHFSKYAKMLKKQPEALCLSCHDRTYGQGKDQIANIKEVLDKNEYKHGPILEKDCSACHNPHGSKFFRILRSYFPPVFYSSYDPKNYSLCFMCHEKTIASQKFTTTLTNFRNGDLNLHYVHVNKPVKGRTCRACHNPHATNNPKHIRDSVPFGKWNLPINYTKTKTGGQCQPGCHQLFRYDRNKAAVNRK